MNDKNAAWPGMAGKVCVVTGGASGIGAQTARRLAAVGAAVAILDLQQAAASAVAGEIVAAGGQAIGVAADVTSPPAVAAAAAAVKDRLGLCEVLVNNAGIQLAGSLLDIDLERWNRALAVNLTGALLCVQSFARQMIEGGRGGSIVNIGSITGSRPRPNGGSYSASKAGIAMLSKQMMLEFADYGIRSNLIAPGLIRTPLSEKAYQDPEILHRRLSLIPSGRIGDTQDVANLVVFLASDQSSYINGQTILVDGGLSEGIMKVVHQGSAGPSPGISRA